MPKRHSYKIAFKLQVVAFAKEHGNKAAARHFGPPPTEKMVREWRRQEEGLKQIKGTMHGRRSSKKVPKWPELEEELKNWVREQRNVGFSVSTKMIMEQGKKIAVEKNLGDFKGGATWCYRFMKRQGLSMRVRTHLAQKMPNEYEAKILQFQRYVIQTRKEKGYELGQMGNMDEVPLTFDVPSNRTVDVKGTKSINVKTTGNEKTHYTVALACLADGSKLPPMLIFKRKTIPKEKLPSGVVVHVQEKGWMDEDGMGMWLNKIWSRRPGGLLRKPSLLVWDQFRAHTTDTIKRKMKQLNTTIAVIPGGLTSQLQPLDVSLNKPFKSFMREEWGQWLAAGNHEVTATGRIKRPSIAQVCEWVKRSWDRVKPETVVKAFKKCGISNAMDGTEDDMIFEENEEENEDEDDPAPVGASDESDLESDNEHDFEGFGSESDE